jgi:hypothetical protein
LATVEQPLKPSLGSSESGYWLILFAEVSAADQDAWSVSGGNVRIIALVLINFMAGVAHAETYLPASVQKKSVTVIYSGRMMGYFRYPDQQQIQTSGGGCADPSPLLAEASQNDVSTMSNAARFLHELKKLRKSSETVLIGTGDNFAPEHYAATVAPSPAANPYGLRTVPKDWLVWDFLSNPPRWITNEAVSPALRSALSTGRGWVAEDNVACFLKTAQYDAIVPGKFDFYFGPERLRQLARLLASDGREGLGSVQMLGANLVISTRERSANPRIPVWLQKDTIQGIPAEFGSEIKRGDVVLPWLRIIRLAHKKDSQGRNLPQTVEICGLPSTSDSRNPDAIPGLQASKEPGACTGLIEFTNTKGDSAYRMPDGFVLQPGSMYAVTLRIPSGQGEKVYADQFFTAQPFFTYPNPINAPGAHPQPVDNSLISPAPYALKKSADPEKEVAIFGIVDQELKNSIGSLNYSWVNEHRGLMTEVDILDPMLSLGQVLQYFDEDYQARYGRPFQGRKILLAQMRYPRAQEVTSVFPGVFSAVVAESDNEHASDQYEMKIKVAPTTTDTGLTPSGAIIATETAQNLQWIVPTVALIPKPFYDANAQMPAFKLKLQLQMLQFGKAASCSPRDGAACTEAWHFDHQRVTSTLTNPQHRLLSPKNPFSEALFSLARNLKITTDDADPKTAQEVASIFERVTLATIRRYPGASSLPFFSKTTEVDVAMLQKRDWFDAYVDKIPDNASQDLLQETLDRILWKGDFIHRIAVTGAQLRSAIEQSSVFDRLDADALSLTHERRRGLSVLGLYKDPVSMNYFINGDPLDDKRLYSVATSDFAAFGDTGYPSLREQIGRPVSPDNVNMLLHISALVCSQFKATEAFAHATCRPQVNLNSYFDEISATPLDPAGELTPGKNFLNWLTFRVPPDPIRRAPKHEKSVQERGRWNFAIENVSAGYSINQHNAGTEKNLADRLSGIQESGLTDAKTSSWNTRFYSEASRIQRRFRPFLREEFDFQRRITRLEDESIKPERPRNNLGLEAGIRVPLPLQNLIGKVQLTASLRGDTQVKVPYSVFVLGKDKEGRSLGTLILDGQKRNGTLVEKLGFRLEGRGKTFDFGFQSGTTHSVPAEYIFYPGTSQQWSCVVPTSRTGQSVANCIRQNGTIDSNTPFSIRFTDRPARGIFWNVQLAAPLRQERFTYNIETRGNLYFHSGNDSSIETYYLTTISQSLRIPILGQLSLVPKLDLIFFENKVERHSLTRIQSSVMLMYVFDWRSGLPLRKAAGFGLKK